MSKNHQKRRPGFDGAGAEAAHALRDAVHHNHVHPRAGGIRRALPGGEDRRLRSYAQDWLGEQLDVPVHIDRGWATPSLDVVLENVTSLRSNEQAAASFRVSRLALRWSLANGFRPDKPILRRLELTGCVISFAPGAAGGWEPETLEPLAVRLGEWGGFDVKVTPAEPASDAGRRRRGAQEDGSAACTRVLGSGGRGDPGGADGWCGRNGEEQAFAEGVEFESTPISVPGRDFHYFRLTMNSVRAAGGRRLRTTNLNCCGRVRTISCWRAPETWVSRPP